MNQTFDQLVGQRLARRREELGKSQEKIEEEASLSDRYLGKIELGKVSAEFYTICKICDALDIDVGELHREVKKKMNDKK